MIEQFIHREGERERVRHVGEAMNGRDVVNMKNSSSISMDGLMKGPQY